MDKYSSLRNKKNEFREKYKKLRLEFPPNLKTKYDRQIFNNISETLVFKHSTQILCYAAKPYEIETSLIWQYALSSGKRILFPKCLGEHNMKFYYVYGPEGLKPGKFGLMEPDAVAEYSPDSSDICIVPALSYDKYGYRLGYGKGYYDRFLSGFNGAKVGLCYSSFVESQLPKGRYDVKVDVLITENGVQRLHK